MHTYKYMYLYIVLFDILWWIYFCYRRLFWINICMSWWTGWRPKCSVHTTPRGHCRNSSTCWQKVKKKDLFKVVLKSKQSLFMTWCLDVCDWQLMIMYQANFCPTIAPTGPSPSCVTISGQRPKTSANRWRTCRTRFDPKQRINYLLPTILHISTWLVLIQFIW